MTGKPLVFAALAGMTLLWTTAAPAEPDMPTDDALKAQCIQYADEDQIAPEYREEFILQCILDLKERYQPEEPSQDSGEDFPPIPPSDT